MQDLGAISVLGDAFPEVTAGRSYYAAFHAVSAWFVLQGFETTRHEAIRTAVHRDLVKAGSWTPEYGSRYDWLMTLRHVGDYAADREVTVEDAQAAAEWARRLVLKVHEMKPDVFEMEEKAL